MKMVNVISKGIAYDVVKLVLKNKLFTTDGKLVTMDELLDLVVIDDEPTKLDFSKFQTSHYFGRDTTLSYVYDRYTYDIQLVSTRINSEIATLLYKNNGKHTDYGWFINFDDDYEG